MDIGSWVIWPLATILVGYIIWICIRKWTNQQQGTVEASNPLGRSYVGKIANTVMRVLPPKYEPGDVMDGMDFAAVSQVLEDIQKSADMLTDRSCAIGIANGGNKTLKNPRYHLYSGNASTIQPGTISHGRTGLRLFTKKSGFATGTVGVLTYDIDQTDFCLAIMWSVPYDFNIFSIWFKLKIYPKSRVVDRALYYEMYSEATWTPGNYMETSNEEGVVLRGSITNHCHAKFYVYIDASNL